MTKLRIMFLVVGVLWLSDPLAACDLELTIRPHTDRVVFGDPLYVEVTIVNRGEEPVSGPLPRLWFNTLWFTISCSDARLSYTHRLGGAGGCKPIVFEPDKPVKYYCYFLFPHFRRFDNPFWKLFRDGGRVAVLGVYRFRPGVLLTSKYHYVSVEARDESEIASLAYWRKREVKREDYKGGPTPADFRLPVHIANREELASFAFDAALSGELGGLVALSLRFRDLYELPPERREAGNRALVEWLRKEPDMERTGDFYRYTSPEGGIERVRLEPEVKRQVLLRELRNLAGCYNMTSTFEALGGGDWHRPNLIPEGGIWDIKPEKVEPDE